MEFATRRITIQDGRILRDSGDDMSRLAVAE
jgi:hypothetical protein